MAILKTILFLNICLYNNYILHFLPNGYIYIYIYMSAILDINLII